MSSTSVASLLLLRQYCLTYFDNTNIAKLDLIVALSGSRWALRYVVSDHIWTGVCSCSSSWTNGIVRIWQYMCVILWCMRICLFAFWCEELLGVLFWQLSKSRSRIAGEGVELKLIIRAVRSSLVRNNPKRKEKDFSTSSSHHLLLALCTKKKKKNKKRKEGWCCRREGNGLKSCQFIFFICKPSLAT